MKPRSIHVIEPSGELYGSEFCLLDIIEQLADRDSITVHLPPNTPFAEKLAEQKVEIQETLPPPSSKRRIAKVATYLKLLSFWIRHRPDVVYLNQAGAIRPIGSICRTLRIPLVSQVQTLEDAIWVNRNARTLRRVSSFICNSRYIARSLSVEPERKSILYQGYRWKSLESDSPRSPATPFVVGLLGRISVSKGHYLLVEAAELLFSRGESKRDWKFVIIGSGKTKEEEKALHDRVAKAGLSDQFSFRGYRSDIAAELQALDVLAIPSFLEPLGRILFEAAEAGVPTVNSDGGGLGEVGRHFSVGRQFKSGNANDLADALVWIRDHYSSEAPRFRRRASEMLDSLQMSEYIPQVDRILSDASEGKPSSVHWFGIPLKADRAGASSAKKQIFQYFTNLDYTRNGGGNYVVSASVFDQLERHYPGTLHHQIPVQTSFLPNLFGKFQRRVFHLKSSIPQFSQRSGEKRAEIIASHLQGTRDFAFFKGVTPWVDWVPDRPYFVYTDVGFLSLLKTQGSTSLYSEKALQKIVNREARFLSNAQAVFFESQWGVEQTVSDYGISEANLHSPGRFGIFPVAGRDQWRSDSFQLVSIAKHFRQKGGDLIAEAFHQLRPRYPTLQWRIIGGPPDFPTGEADGILYEGFLKPDNHEDRARYEEILRTAFLLIHPTREDTNPLVITEAASFGCPTVSVQDFAIPDLVDHEESGILLSRPITAEQLANQIVQLIENPQLYSTMREAALRKAMENGDWHQIGNRFCKIIEQQMEGLNP